MLNYQLAKHLHLFREEGGAGKEARLTVFLWLMLRANKRSRSWGGAEKIAIETGFGKGRVIEALDWLKEVGAIEVVPKAQRKGEEERTRSDVYEMTGVINLENQTVPYLYLNESQEEPNGTENEPLDKISSTENAPLETNGTVNETNGTVNGVPSSIYELNYELKESNERTNEGEDDRTDQKEKDQKEVAEADEGRFTKEEFRALLEKIKRGYEAKWEWSDDVETVLSRTIKTYPQYAHYLPAVIEVTKKDHPRSMAMVYFEGCLRGWHSKGFVPTHIRYHAGEQVDEASPTPQVKYMDSPAPGESEEDDEPTPMILAIRARMAEAAARKQVQS